MEKLDKVDIVVITHRIWTDGKRKKGGLDKIVDYVIGQNKTVLVIEHPLAGLKESKVSDVKTRVTVYYNGKDEELFCKSIRQSSEIKSWIGEVLFNQSFLRKNISKKTILFVADPLSAVIGLISPLRFRCRYIHCVDYSDSRFDNSVLNTIYAILYFLIFKFYNYIGVVSLKTKKSLVSRGCNKKKLIYIPNSPIFKEYNLKNKDENSIICSGRAVLKNYCMEKMVDIIFLVKKEIGNVLFSIVGDLKEDPNYVKKLKDKIDKLDLNKNIKFTGFLSQDQLNTLLLKTKLGLSFYSPEVWYYTKFGDSLKIREYSLFGIPAITDGNSATDVEMEKNGAGIIVKEDEEAARKIVYFLKDDAIYTKYQADCVRWARRMDKKLIIDNLLKKLDL